MLHCITHILLLKLGDNFKRITEFLESVLWSIRLVVGADLGAAFTEGEEQELCNLGTDETNFIVHVV